MEIKEIKEKLERSHSRGGARRRLGGGPARGLAPRGGRAQAGVGTPAPGRRPLARNCAKGRARRRLGGCPARDGAKGYARRAGQPRRHLAAAGWARRGLGREATTASNGDGFVSSTR